MLLHALPLRLMQTVADTPAITFALVIALLGLIYLLVQTRRVLAMDNGNQVMQEIAAAIQEGAAAFLNREYTFLGGFVVVVAAIIVDTLARMKPRYPEPDPAMAQAIKAARRALS